MTKVRKNIHLNLSGAQLFARGFMVVPRGKQIQGRMAQDNPRISPQELQALSIELSAIMNELGQADLDAAFRRGDFATPPPARQWPSDVFKADEDHCVVFQSLALVNRHRFDGIDTFETRQGLGPIWSIRPVSRQ